MKKFIEPKVKVIKLQTKDILTTSGVDFHDVNLDVSNEYISPWEAR